ncbi:MAG: arginine--tRNA ligase [Persicimonas sp.]
MRIDDIETRLEALKATALRALKVPEEAIEQIRLETPPDPTMGDRGFPCFVLARHLKKAPPLIAEEVAEQIREALDGDDLIAEVRATGPYVNFVFDRAALARIVVSEALDDADFGADTVATPEHWMIEYSAPNTNKPQHLGHVRNDLLGQTVAQIAERAGHSVTRVNLINDRGIHICKSMLAYQQWGEGAVPEDTEEKGDHLVGRYYVRFNKEFRGEYHRWQETEEATERFEAWLDERDDDDLAERSDEELRADFFDEYEDDYFNRHSELGRRAKEMLRKWEAGDEETVELWETMRQWVIDGFEETYERLGVEFDRVYYESETYRLGKEAVLEGLDEGKFERLDDGAVVCDLDKVDLQGQKVLLRSDGTTVYMTQDIGTAFERFEEYDLDRMIYVVGDEQDYHFRVLFAILELLDPDLEGKLEHLSYGMVELPEGKMKSREGKVVDADDLMDEMVALARGEVEERWPDLDDEETAHRADVIGMAALKYYILDFNPRTTVSFDPKESIDFQGRTGPYCLYSYARIQSIGRRLGGWPDLDEKARAEALEALGTDLEMTLVRKLKEWPTVAATAARDLDPSRITEYLFHLCKAFSTLYNNADHRMVDIDDESRRAGLMYLSRAVGRTLQTGLGVLGIETLDEM